MASLTFYHDFNREPQGRHVLKICRAESCQSMGAEKMALDFLARLKLEWGKTTPDGALTVEPVYCLGLCSHSPSALFDGEPIGRVDGATARRTRARGKKRMTKIYIPRDMAALAMGAKKRRRRRSRRKPPRAASMSRSFATARAACSGSSLWSRSRRRRAASATAR